MGVGEASIRSLPFRSERVSSPAIGTQHCQGIITSGPESTPIWPIGRRLRRHGVAAHNQSCPTNHGHGAATAWLPAVVSRRVQKRATRRATPSPDLLRLQDPLLSLRRLGRRPRLLEAGSRLSNGAQSCRERTATTNTGLSNNQMNLTKPARAMELRRLSGCYADLIDEARMKREGSEA
jgi:hypothetical protein